MAKRLILVVLICFVTVLFIPFATVSQALQSTPISTPLTPTPAPIVTSPPAVPQSFSNQQSGWDIDTQSAAFLIGIEAISVLLFGGILALVLEWQRRKHERHQREQLSTESRISYLKGIRREVKTIIEPFESLLIDEKIAEEMADRGEQIPQTRPFESLEDLQKTTYWEALVPSGLLPSVTSPETLSKIAEFYQQLRVTVSLLRHRYEQIDRGERLRSDNKYAARVMAAFQEEDDRQFVRERLAPSLLDLVQQGADLVVLLDGEIGQFSGDDYEQEPQEATSAERDSEFEDIYLVDLNEHLSSRKIDPYKNDWGRTGRTNIFDQEIDEIELGLVLRLSAKPPEEWGDRLYYGDYDYYENRKYAEVQHRYVIFEGTSKELIEHLAELEEAIAEKNKRYRELLAERADEELRKAEIEKEAKNQILATKEIVDSSLSQNKM